ncbi:MAG: hypothetical protein LBP22_17310 [Deltaproteobacteria bacterium]|nr:hypothetical protein [Deltaproteobacteria bacterium]
MKIPNNNSRNFKSAPQGMILVMTLILVLLMTVTGGVLLYKNRSELATTTNYRNHQKALSNADMVMKVATRALDIMITQTSIAKVRDFFAYTSGYKYKFSFDDNFVELLSKDNEDRKSVKSRYLGAGSTTGTNKPDIIVRDENGRIVGLARVSFDFVDHTVEYGSKMSGESMEDAGKGASQDTVNSYYVITVVGRDPDVGGGDLYAADAATSAGPQAFLTALYCVGSKCRK